MVDFVSWVYETITMHCINAGNSYLRRNVDRFFSVIAAKLHVVDHRTSRICDCTAMYFARGE